MTCTNQQQPKAATLRLVLWAIWAVALVWLFLLNAILPAFISPATASPLPTYVGLALAISAMFGAMVVRATALPKAIGALEAQGASALPRLLASYVAGLALAEVSTFLAIFLLPEGTVERSLTIGVAMTVLAVQAPYFAKSALAPLAREREDSSDETPA